MSNISCQALSVVFSMVPKPMMPAALTSSSQPTEGGDRVIDGADPVFRAGHVSGHGHGLSPLCLYRCHQLFQDFFTARQKGHPGAFLCESERL